MNLATGMASMVATKFKTDGLAATYTPIGGQAMPVTVVPGKSVISADDSAGGIISAESPDFFVRSSEIIGQPRPGDQINVSGEVFLVMLLADNLSWRWADWPNRSVYRIHTKRVS